MRVSAGGQRAIVVGGGLAGITAALDLADRGADVVLLEAEARLGGRTCSFAHGDHTFDHGQPVFLRCCTAYRGLIDRIGAADRVVLQPSLDLPVLSPGGSGPAMLRAAPLPPPFHLAPSLTRYHHLSFADRARIRSAARALRALDPDDPTLDHCHFDDWLAEHQQSRAAIERYWNVVARPLQNLPMAEVSLAVAAKIFRTAWLDDATGADIGWTTAPLSEVHGTFAARALEEGGVDVRLRSRVARLITADGGVEGVAVVGPTRPRDGERVDANAVILAVPPLAAARLLRPHVRVPEPNDLLALGTSPVVNVHLVVDRRVTDYPIAVAVSSPVQIVFDRSDAAGVATGQQCIVSSMGAAADAIERPSHRLVVDHVAALRALLPAMRNASLVDAVVTRRRAGTLASAPGNAARRPGPGTDISGLFLAGAWTATGWPDSMESAVRSGHIAAAAASSDGDMVGMPHGKPAMVPP